MLQRCSSNNTTPLSFLFPVSSAAAAAMDEAASTYSSAVVDCTLSLGTPSTRSTTTTTQQQQRSSFCWDIITHSKTHARALPQAANTSSSRGDPLLLARRCANCDTTSTPLWRNGPRGPKSLCNACGIRFKKEERRAAASTTAAAGGGGGSYGRQQQQYQRSCYPTAAGGGGGGNEHEMVDYFSSWRLGVVPTQFPVAERTAFFHYQ